MSVGVVDVVDVVTRGDPYAVRFFLVCGTATATATGSSWPSLALIGRPAGGVERGPARAGEEG